MVVDPKVEIIVRRIKQYTSGGITKEDLNQCVRQLTLEDKQIMRSIYLRLYTDNCAVFVCLLLELFKYTQKDLGLVLGISRHRVGIWKSRGRRVINKLTR